MEGLAENRFDVERGNEHRIRKGGSCEKKKIKWIGGLLALCLMAEPTAVAMAKAESEVQETEIDEETEIHPGERTATIVVVSITGNELTYYEVEDETETEEASEETEQNETDLETENGSEKSEISEKSDKGAKSEEKNTQKDGGMTPPDGMPQGDNNMAPPDGMPQEDSGMTPPDGISQGDSDASGMPENMPSGDFQKGGRSEQQNTKTVYLPVPVVVHTDTDEKRTFSILEAGDCLQVTIVTDEEGNEIITEIWMLKE